MADFEPSPTGYVAVYGVRWPHLDGEEEVACLPVVGYRDSEALIITPQGAVKGVSELTLYHRDVPCYLALVRPVIQLFDEE